MLLTYDFDILSTKIIKTHSSPLEMLSHRCSQQNRKSSYLPSISITVVFFTVFTRSLWLLLMTRLPLKNIYFALLQPWHITSCQLQRFVFNVSISHLLNNTIYSCILLFEWIHCYCCYKFFWVWNLHSKWPYFPPTAPLCQKWRLLCHNQDSSGHEGTTEKILR